jgi:sulfide-dependent adenosine diphosphate thiazole synthase
MTEFTDYDVSKAILDAYHDKYSRALRSDVVIVGAGPSGMVAGWRLAEAGRHVVILEKRLSCGGGIWGGSQGMNEVAIQDEAVAVLDDVGVRHRQSGSLHTADAMELASALCVKALQAGAIMLNLTHAEDLCVDGGRVCGVVANRTLLSERVPLDPIVLTSRAVIDATGHDADLARCLQKRGILRDNFGEIPGEGPMNASAGEKFVVEHVAEVYPGLWTTGMSVCTCHGGPRMGPIFGGMLLSGLNVAKQIDESLQA